MGLTTRHDLRDRRHLETRPAPHPGHAIPEYAGTRQRHAEALIENEDRKPVRILDVTGTFWDFDEAGRIDVALRKSLGDWLDVAFAKPRMKEERAVVDLLPELKKKDLQKNHRWTITKDELDLIAADIWPGVHGPAPEVASVKGRAPKRPPLPHDAKHAMQEIGGKLEMIKFELRRLNEHSLKGLEFEALRTASFEDETLCCGVAAEAKLQRETRAAYQRRVVRGH